MTLRKPSRNSSTRLFDSVTDSGEFPATSDRGSSRRKTLKRERRDEKRRSLMENLETRQLLAGPDLIGIQPNEGDLLLQGDVLRFSPNELVFRFDDNNDIDPSTLDAIRITRAGEDGTFESARVSTDLGTSGQALFEFRARQAGSFGNGIQINLISESRVGSSTPIVTTNDRVVTINFNSSATTPTRASDLLSAVNNNVVAGALIEAIQVSGPSLQPVGLPSVNGTTLTLDGANAAQAVTDFGTNGAVRVRLISQRPGVEGRGTEILVESRNFGGTANPVVVVTDQTVRVQLNSFAGDPSTADDFVQAINSNPQASQLISASIQEGSGATVIGQLSGNLAPITLGGVSDVVVEPGFVGIGDSTREVVFRFAEPLPDDLYQIDILGSGVFALRDTDGESFRDGQDLTQTFEINLGTQVVAVVPEPIRRASNGSLSPDTGKIDVHFNDDDLNATQATNPSFYQLIFTRDTIDNNDDVVVVPNSVTYNSITNIATLDFSRALSRITDPNDPNAVLEGSARLRVGTTEGLPSRPTPVQLPTNPTNAVDGAGDHFDAAYNLNADWDLSGATTTRSATLTSEIRNERRFGLELPGPDVVGTRDIRPDDPTRLDRVVPLDYVRGGADAIDGISVIEYDFVGSWLGDDPDRPGIIADTTYTSIITEQQRQRVREVMTLYSEYLGVNFIEVDDRNPNDIGGFSIAVGDLYGGDEREASGQGGLAVVTRDRDGNGIDDLVVMDFQDFEQSDDDQFGGEFFRGAMFGVGQLLGYGYADDLPQPVTQSTSFIFQPGTDNEPAFPSAADIVHGQFLYRPDSTDIDLYTFTLTDSGALGIETIAERLGDASLLDSHLRVYWKPLNSQADFQEIAQNDDYFSNDSLIRIPDAVPGDYMVGVSAKGNDAYDPIIPSTGFGGLSEGAYELRLDFTPSVTSSLTDTTGVPLDGDADGRPGGTFDYWFKIADFSETLFVDKGHIGLNNPSGRISQSLGDIEFVEAFRNRSIGLANNPYSQIDEAVADSQRISELRLELVEGTFNALNQLRASSDPLQVQRADSIANYLTQLDLTIRIVGNGGSDGLAETLQDNFSFNVGFSNNGLPLEDGSSLELPADVQLIIDSGAIIKFSRARLGVGSVAPTLDLSGSNLQVLGTPAIVGANGQLARDSASNIIPGSVFLTSVNDDSIGTGNQIGITPNALPGDWGGIDFRGDLDDADELRQDLEDQGIFRNHIQFANLRYGGGSVSIGGRDAVVSPIDMAITRPTIINSHIADSADAALAATPDTFREDRFTAPEFQQAGIFTPDYDRVGPEIHGNTLSNNSINGLFVRLATRSGEALEDVSQSTRFDDSDIPHVLTENLVITGTPGGPAVQAGAPSSLLISASEQIADGSVPAGTYAYRLTNVTDTGLESAASAATAPVTTTATGGIRLQGLPTAVSGSATVSRRLYRANVDANGQIGLFALVAQLNASDTGFTDRVAVGGALLELSASPLRSRLDASLVIDPGTVLKVDGARIEARFGANFIAEGLPSNPVVITSLEDQRYGGGGTFDTNARGNSAQLNPGDWGGIYIGNGSSASIDNAVLAGGGGNTRIEGGFASFNTIEVHQADLRLTNSRIENNADGRGQVNTDPLLATRVGRNDNASGAVYVRASTPIIANTDFIDNAASAISIDVNSLNSDEVSDYGRATGRLNSFDVVGNSGPLIEDNTLTRNSINGMTIRGGQLVTEGVWDDVGMVHVVTDSIEIPNKHIFGGLRLVSDARGSLVVKFETDNPGDPAGIVVGGSLFTAADEFRDIPDRIGGALQLVGHPDFPVILTTLQDDFAGAGFTIDGRTQVDTNNDGIIGGDLTTQAGTLPTGPEVNLGTTIDNDVDPTIVGSFSASIGDAGDIGFGFGAATGSAVTVENIATGNVLQAQNFIFQYNTMLTSGGASVQLSATTITQPATLIADDVVESRGTYAGPNGDVNWVATSSFNDGVATLFNSVELTSAAALGDIRVVSYLDEDVLGVLDDVMYTVGTPGQADFRIYTVDGALRVGFSHGGFYFDDGENQENATYEGWAADVFPELEAQILAGTQTYSIAGDIDLVDLPQGPDPTFGNVWGPNDVTTAHSWIVDPSSNNAQVTNFLELLAADPVVRDPRFQIQSGNWNGVVVREGADDRNVAAIAEQEPVRTTVFDTNAIPSQSQFLGELAPDEQSGDENRRLGFIIDGAIATRDDIDVYSFVAESNTEVWLDIDRTSNNLDTVIELIDFNGQVLAASNDSLLAEQNVNTGLFVSNRLDDDAAQPLTVNEERLQVQQINISRDIENATAGSVTLGLDSTTNTVAISVANFLQDPAGSVEAALNAGFPSELGSVSAQLLRSATSPNLTIELTFDQSFFTGRQVPGVRASVVSVTPTIPAAFVTNETPTAVLQDTYSSNAKDAGMRIRLPGETGTRNLYHVRVRSSNTPDPRDLDTLVNGDVLGGLTRGRYSMQIRLQEVDESAGTQVRLSDIRYATTGLQVIGQPLHSPLLGEEAETSAANDTADAAQRLGYLGVNGDQAIEAGPLQSDRLAKSIAGSIDSATDVDWYQFEINYENLTRDGSPLLLSTIFDLDYASNFARSDMALYVFDAAGNLIYTGTDSNVAEDLPASRTANSTDDLSRGGAGQQDPFIGSVELSEGTYFLAVANQTQVPISLDQFFNPASANPLVRLEPIRAIDRIADDNFNNRVLFDDNAIVPYSLTDVILYVNDGSGLFAVNPFTGQNYGRIGNFGDEILDIAFRANGELQAYTEFSTRPNSDGNWSYVQIDTGTAAITNLQPGVNGAGIETRFDAVPEPAVNGILPRQQLEAPANVGLSVEAITIREFGTNEQGFFVANREQAPGSSDGVEYFTNILYDFSPETGLAQGPTVEPVFRDSAGAGTTVREVGQIDTQALGNQPATRLGIPAPFVISSGGLRQAGIVDNDTFSLLVGDDQDRFNFEFEADSSITTTGASVLDGETVRVGAVTYEFDTGPRLALGQINVPGGLEIGQTLVVNDSLGGSVTFEFVIQGAAPVPGNVPISIQLPNGNNRGVNAVAQDLATAIEIALPSINATRLGNEIAFDAGATFQPIGNGLQTIGADGPADPATTNRVITIEESAGSLEIINALRQAIENENLITVTQVGTTIQVPGVSVIDTTASGAFIGNTDGATSADNIIGFSLFDTETDLAARVATAINELIGGDPPTAAAVGDVVVISDGAVSQVSGNLVAGGGANGGTVTGVEILGGNVYAVTDTGGLYVVTAAELGGGNIIHSNRQIGSYVSTSTDLIDIPFTGLRAGPPSVDGGAYSNILFGLTAAGEIYAFNTAGQLQPVFAGGRSSISTGIANPQGLDFSTLDFNLWHRTITRSGDAGHGGGNSLAFNYEPQFNGNFPGINENPDTVARRDGQNVTNTYNFPGGAKGAVQSVPFSLENYSPGDSPTLYFNYLIDADGGDSTDSLRVYLVQPDGTQHAVALNTTARGAGSFDDEFDDPPVTQAPYNDVIDVDKQQLFDNTDTWRQARVPLDAFAGEGNLRLRIEFATSGVFGDDSGAIYAVGAEDLTEGQTLVVNRERFSVNFPPTLVTPSGVEISTAYSLNATTRASFELDGQTFVLNDGTRVVDTSLSDPNDPNSAPNEISIDLTSGGLVTVSSLTAAEIASLVLAATQTAAVDTAVADSFVFDGNSIEFGDATDLTTSGTVPLTVRNVGAPTDNLINVRAAMSADEVAQAVSQALNDFFTRGIATNGQASFFPVSGAVVNLPGFTVNNAGPFGSATNRYAERFGATNIEGARDNDHEGIYLDDFVIGLAERGERVTDVRPGRAGVENPFVTDQRFAFPNPSDPRSNLVTGAYQVEIRDGSEYIASGIGTQFREFDSNARLSDGISLVTQPASSLRDGQTFSITDGRATVSFEFDFDGNVTPGTVGIPISLSVTDETTGLLRPQSETEVANAVIDAINRSDVRSVLNVQAVPSTGFQNETAVPAGIKQVQRVDSGINLIGEVVVADPTDAFAAVTRSELRGDSNRDRDAQGVIIVENSRFLFNQDYGVDISHNITTSVAGNTTQSIVRYPRNLVELNSEDLAPGVVVQSNVLAFNGVGGIQVQGTDANLSETTDDLVSIERIVNNTIIGGSVARGVTAPADTFEGVLFPSGRISFADEVVQYSPGLGADEPASIHQDSMTALGAPDCNGRGPEPADGQFSVSLGLSGSITLQFTNNFLTGSGDSQPDLAIFETGEIESVQVEISRDGVTYFDVGIVGGISNLVDIDQFGFGANERFAFVRLTDLRQGSTGIPSLGADIDSVGAISSVPVDTFTPGGVGINIVGDASPTILNNVISNSDTGVGLTGNNSGFISGGNAYYQNNANTTTGVGLGTLPQLLTNAEAVFVDPGAFVFSPAAGSRIIDSSIDSLPDRASLTTVRNAIGIAPSPTLAPRLDVNGQLRVDDPNVEPPSGLGEQVFKDRGGFDRGDLDGPRVTLLSPLAPGIGLDAGRATVLGNAPQAFEIQLIDGIPPADIVPGTGIDDRSVSSESLVLFRDGVPQVEGIDYRFAYNPSTNIIRLTPIAGVWRDNSTYVIRMIDSRDAIIRAGEGVIYNDGDQLNVLNEVGQRTTFEYETGILVDLSGSLTGPTADGISFAIYDGNVLREYEFDNNNASGLIPITIPQVGTSTEFAAALAAAINADTLLNLTARSSGGRVQLVGGSPLASITSNSTLVQTNGTIGTDTGFGFQIPNLAQSTTADVADGQSFTVRLGSFNEVTFEFDNDGIVNNVDATPIPFIQGNSLEQLADEVVRVIGGSGLGLAPSNAGFGRVFLGGDANYSVALANSNLTQISLPGQPASVPINIPIDQTAEQIVEIIRQTIDAQNLAGVSTSIVDTRVFLEGTTGVSGVGAVDTVVVQDQVGNLLQNNQADGRTELTIFVGRGFDYGDAPAPYTSLLVNDGPRHAVNPGLTLGASINADSDAELPNADGSDDGISLPSILQAGFSASVGIFVRHVDESGQSANTPVYVDAWFDWDQDGQFEVNEQVRFGTTGTNRTPVFANSTTNVLINVPASAVNGETYARFRLSESPTTGPIGEASSGEVEDYQIIVSNNPFQNPSGRYDVNASGTVTPLDALQIINALAQSGQPSIDLQVTPISQPQFPDVSGDGQVSPFDALQVINELSRQSSGAGGEGELTSESFVAAGPGVLASTPTAIGDQLITESVVSDFVQGPQPATEASTEQPVEFELNLDANTSSKTSVFDSTETIVLDSIVDELAADAASVENESKDSESILDSVFSQL